jgi:hypothetical protein
MLAIGFFLAPAIAQAQPVFPPDFVARLNQVGEIHVGTQRKDGSRSDVVPVWFAYVDGAIWFATKPSSVKAQRVKAGSPMYVSASGADGPFIETKAEIVNDTAMATRLGEIYSSKYWLAWFGYQRPSRNRLEEGKIILLKLMPAQ